MAFESRRRLFLVVPSLVLAGCGQQAQEPLDPRAKIELDLEALDADGLRGPPDGKVAVDYEFAIPDTPAAREAVSQIDPSVNFFPGSRGRIGAQAGECLCIGSTHQPRHREILLALARLPEIARIIECHHE
jgi:hypothetical protein